MNLFYALFYGPGTMQMGRIYLLVSEQGQFRKESWEIAASNARTPIWGDWDRINHPPQPAEDQTLPLPPVPSAGVLVVNSKLDALGERRLQMAGRFLADNDQLLDLLHENLQRVEFNRYNLELYLAIAQLYRQNLQMLLDLARINTSLGPLRPWRPRVMPRERLPKSMRRSISPRASGRRETRRSQMRLPNTTKHGRRGLWRRTVASFSIR